MVLLKKSLAILAQKGVLVSISAPYFNQLHSQDIGKTRALIKDFTRHNDKLGADYSKIHRRFVQSVSPQFGESAYKAFVSDALKFYKLDAKYQATSEHFE